VYKDVHCSTAERIVGAAKPFRRNGAERRNPEKPDFCEAKSRPKEYKKTKLRRGSYVVNVGFRAVYV